MEDERQREEDCLLVLVQDNVSQNKIMHRFFLQINSTFSEVKTICSGWTLVDSKSSFTNYEVTAAELASEWFEKNYFKKM